jgi:tetratricopeptide (TPR) repeat protein
VSASLDQEIRTLQSIYWSERDPDGLAFAPLADAFLRGGQVREALVLLTDGTSRHPDFATGHVVATRLYYQQGMLGEAEFAARRVLELDGENLVGLSILSSVLDARGESEEAASLRTRLAAIDPESEEARSPVAVTAAAVSADMDDQDEGSDGGTLQELTLAEAGEHSGGPQDWEPGELDDALATLGLSEEGAEDSIVIEDLAPVEEGYDTGPEIPAPEVEVMDLASLAPDAEPEVEVMDLASLAPDAEPEVEVVDLASLAPDAEPEVEVMDLASLAPDAEPEVEVMDLASLAPDPEPEGDANMRRSEPVYTRTLAELYLKQGFAEKALGVYRHLLRTEPGDPDISARIADLESGRVGSEPMHARARPAPPAVPRPAFDEMEPDETASGRPATEIARRDEEEVETLARDLAESGEGRHEVDTPFAWTEEEDSFTSEEEDADSGIGGYFDRLLAWEDPEAP